MARRGPQELPTYFVAEVFRGLRYPFEGLAFIRRHRLWGMAVVPIIVNVVLFIILLTVTIWIAVPWLDRLEAWMTPNATSSELFRGIMSVVSWIIWVAAVLLVIIVDSILLLLLGQAVASPFLDLLSEKVEVIVLGTEPEPTTVARTIRSVVVACADVIWSLTFWLLVNLPILLINFVPVIGTAVAAILSFCFTALLLTQEFAGLTMARQLVSYPGRFRVVWRNRWLSLGFGSTAMLMVMVPVINLVLLPLAAVGGTLLYCDLKAAGRVDVMMPEPSEM